MGFAGLAMKRDEYAYAVEVIERLLRGDSVGREWDDFISIRCRDRFLEGIRIACAHTRDVFPPESEGMYTGYRGMDALKKLADVLRMAL